MKKTNDRRSNTDSELSTINHKLSTNAETAFLAFALLEKLDSGRRLPPPSVSKVFRLYCIEALSAAQVARQCHCSKAAVIRRLKLIRKKTGTPPSLLRQQTSRLPPLHELMSHPAARHLSAAHLFYGATTDDMDPLGKA